MKVHWTDHARRQLRAIHAYIADDAPVYADQVVDELTDRSDQLGNFPHSGRKPLYGCAPHMLYGHGDVGDFRPYSGSQLLEPSQPPWRIYLNDDLSAHFHLR